MYEYMGRIVRVVDGDTLDVEIDLGFSIKHELRLRLLGLNAPEHGSEAGERATEYVRGWVHNHGGTDGRVRITTEKDRKEKYGRFLAAVYGWNQDLDRDEMTDPTLADRHLNSMILETEHAVPYDGGAR
jgi:micrococcal nuclease